MPPRNLEPVLRLRNAADRAYHLLEQLEDGVKIPYEQRRSVKENLVKDFAQIELLLIRNGFSVSEIQLPDVENVDGRRRISFHDHR
jgi:hypothetical protein